MIKPKKDQTIKSDLPLRVIRAVLWIMLIFIFVRGVISVFTADTINEQRAKLAAYMEHVASTEKIKSRASFTAEEFMRAYLTSSSDAATYKNSMQQFAAQGLQIAPPEVSTKALSVATVDVTINGKDIDVRIATTSSVHEESVQLIYAEYVVPIAAEDDRCAVVGLPVLSGMQQKLDVSSYSFSGEPCSEAKAAEIEKTLDAFFRAYYAGNASEISYYTTKDFKGELIPNYVTYDKLQGIKTYVSEDGSRYYAEVNLTIKIANSVTRQKVYVELVQSDRIYIEKIGTRI